jgi:hypothetical protein
VTSDQAGQSGTTPMMVFDGNLFTYFKTDYNNWQKVEIDLGCSRNFSGMRRRITRDGTSESGVRSKQGETVSISSDGVTWEQLTGTNAKGWDSYVNYRPHAWHSIPYGWSAWLRPNTPREARYIRFAWDGNNDVLNEISIDSKTSISDRQGINNTNALMVVDGSTVSFLMTGYDDWQNVQIDLGQIGYFSGLRRYMTRNGTAASGSRIGQGEAVSVSTDGVNWLQLTGDKTSGWDSYVNYRPHAWHSIPYGWSAWLRPNAPMPVRYVRFEWDGDGDALNEVEIDTVLAGRDAGYDFPRNDAAYMNAFASHASGFLGRAGFPRHEIGFTGFYDAWAFYNPWVGSPSSTLIARTYMALTTTMGRSEAK